MGVRKSSIGLPRFALYKTVQEMILQNWQGMHFSCNQGKKVKIWYLLTNISSLYDLKLALWLNWSTAHLFRLVQSLDALRKYCKSTNKNIRFTFLSLPLLYCLATIDSYWQIISNFFPILSDISCWFCILNVKDRIVKDILWLGI